ncbi:MAG TPA: DMT family transporter [Gammaproteobacteria bacterium]|nr:DMT family transporter [Gammaproteobacteria bacterium]
MPTAAVAPSKARLLADAALLLSAVIWGWAFVFQKHAMQHLGPLAFIAARGLVAALALAPFAVREARLTIATRPGFRALAIGGGLAFFGGAWLQQAGLETATVTNSSFLTALYVVITPFIVWAWYGAAPARIVWPAAALSAIGTWLLGGGTFGAFSRGDGLVVTSSFLWALHVVISARAAVHDRPIAFSTIQFAIVGALGTLGAALLETTSLDGLAAVWIDIAFVGVLSSAVTFTVMTAALRHTPAAEAAVIVSTETLFAAGAGYAVLGERLTPIGWLGAAAIIAGILLIQVGAAFTRRRVPPDGARA